MPALLVVINMSADLEGKKLFSTKLKLIFSFLFILIV